MREWIIELYKQYGLNQDNNLDVYKHYDEGVEKGIIPEGMEKETFKRTCRKVRLYLVTQGYYDAPDDDQDVIRHNVNLYKKNQRQQDLLRIERKTFRESARVENALVELNKELLKLLETKAFDKLDTIYNEIVSLNDKVLIVQLSDLHFGEEINLSFNQFNYRVACKRLKLFANKINEFKLFYGIKKVIVFGTGDWINADRILDKLLSNSDNRTKIMFIASNVISQFIQDISYNCQIDVFCTVGNETRVYDTVNIPNEEPLLSHNYDYALFNILKIIFKNNDTIKFINSTIDEAVISVHGHNFLICHGHNLKADNKSDVDAVIRKYATRGVIIDYIVVGHIHDTLIKGNIIRSSGLPGSNKYSESKHYSGIASQNIIVVSKDEVIPIAIPLQNTDSVTNEYRYDESVEEYNSIFNESDSKEVTVFKVVI